MTASTTSSGSEPAAINYPREIARLRLQIVDPHLDDLFERPPVLRDRHRVRGDQTSVDRMCAEFKSRRDVFVAGLNKIKGFSCRMPKGAFYVFPNITKTGWKSKPLADALLEQAGVAALSGTAFGEFGEGYLRFSVANSLENLQQALDRIDQWTKTNL